MAEAPASAGHMLELIRSGRARTRRELQTVTGLSRSTVLQRLDLLVDAGWVRECGVASSTGGRPPTRLEFDEGHAVVLAADLETTHGRAAVLDLAGRPLAERTGPLAVSDGPVAVLDTLAEWFHALLESARRPMSEVCGVGLSVPGPVEFQTGRVVRPPIMAGWDGYDIGPHLQRRLGAPLPVLVDNDANMMALGEQVAGYPECPAFVLVKVSTGIGAGVIVNGEVYRGIDGGAGDIGHVRISGADDALCQCGSYGCLAAVASGRAIAAALTELGLPTSSGSGVRDRLQADQPDTVRLAREAGYRVGEVLATVVSLLNPQVLMIAGDLAGTHFVAGILELLYQRALPRITRNLRVVTGELGDRAALRGTGHLVVEHLYAPARADARLAAGGR